MKVMLLGISIQLLGINIAISNYSTNLGADGDLITLFGLFISIIGCIFSAIYNREKKNNQDEDEDERNNC